MSQMGSHHLHHHHHRLAEPQLDQGGSRSGSPSHAPGSASSAATNHAAPSGKRGHQRRQSVARLLPDISKLRLLSWLVEASNELISCDIAIMDGVYAKLNRSRESLLFWHPPAPTPNRALQPIIQAPVARQQRPARPAPPARQPVPNRLVLQQRNRTTSKTQGNHHSLPVAMSSSSSHGVSDTATSSLLLLGYSSSSSSPSTRPAGKANSLPQPPVGASNSLSCDTATTNESKKRLCDSNQPTTTTSTLHDNKTTTCDDEQLELSNNNQEDDDDSSSASSGIHANSLSSSASSSGSISSSGASSSTSVDHHHHQTTSLPPQVPPPPQQRHAASSAEQLREKIIRTVTEHQHLQNLLVNVIRQHDKRRQQLQLQRRRQMSLDLYPGTMDSSSSTAAGHHSQGPSWQCIDLGDIADALDHGCLCSCHSIQQQQQQHPSSQLTIHQGSAADMVAITKERSSTLPPSGIQSHQVGASGQFALSNNPVRSKTVGRGSNNSGQKKSSRVGSESQQLSVDSSNRQDIINLMSNRLCENCFETHYWLHGSLLDNVTNSSNTGTPTGSGSGGKSSRSATFNDTSSIQVANQSHLNAIISSRNANFIKLVQQQVRATISKSIELIDLIRKEIKLPESIKQKQLMRCFSASIQLLTSVGNYVVPAQDISTFLPEVGGQHNQHQTSALFTLPPSDFDNILYLHQIAHQSPPFPIHPTAHPHAHHYHHLQQHQAAPGELQYHLAWAPEIPLRRSIKTDLIPASLKESPSVSKRNTVEAGAGHTPLSTQAIASSTAPLDPISGQLDSPEKLKTLDEVKQVAGSANESSSGASSNNSSASSSIARGAVQQSSLTRAAEAVQHQSSGLDSPASKTSHGLSFDSIASLSRHRQHQQPEQQHQHQASANFEEDLLFLHHQAGRSNKFWQSSKFNFIKKLLHVRQQRLLRQQSKDRKIYNNKVQNKFRLVMMDLTHFNRSQQLLATENGVNSLLTSMRNVLEFGLYLTLKLY